MTRQEEWAEKRKLWKARIQEWQDSGLTQTEYCRQHDLPMHQLSYWKQRFVRKERPISLVQVNMNAGGYRGDASYATPLRVAVGDRYRVEVEPGFDPATLQQLVFTLERL